MTQPRIYLAGPAVFSPDAQSIAAYLKDACVQRGAIPLHPLDGITPDPADTEHSKQQQALAIYAANRTMIDTCDGVVASLEPFRGPSADAGTCWELGYASALGKAMAAWSPIVSYYRQRVADRTDTEQAIVDNDGYLVEDFDLQDNLMICGPLLEASGRAVFMTFPEALASVLTQLRRRQE